MGFTVGMHVVYGQGCGLWVCIMFGADPGWGVWQSMHNEEVMYHFFVTLLKIWRCRNINA